MMLKSTTVIAFVLMSLITMGQNINRLNKQGERYGKWITYYDKDKKQLCFKGKFRKGDPVGRSYYYLSTGRLEKIEITRFKRIKTTFYYTDGKVRKSGKARMENLPDKRHYYFYGKWKTFGEDGRLSKTEWYKKGELARTVYNKDVFKFNDSLKNVLVKIDLDFSLSHGRFIDSINKFPDNKALQETLRHKLRLKDSLVFDQLTSLVSKKGYPSKQEVGDACGTPFYILSFAGIQIKEFCLPYFIKAADAGDIEWKSLAFFIDKLRVLKGQKQVYGTQFYYTPQKVLIYYPIEDPDNLAFRRKEAGFTDD